jgi:hypothetical protein
VRERRRAPRRSRVKAEAPQWSRVRAGTGGGQIAQRSPPAREDGGRQGSGKEDGRVRRRWWDAPSMMICKSITLDL